jgi:hypothetical protein
MMANSNRKVWTVDPKSMALLDDQCRRLMLNDEQRSEIHAIIAAVVRDLESGTYTPRTPEIQQLIHRDWIADSIPVPGGHLGMDAIDGSIRFEFHRSDLPPDPRPPGSDEELPPDNPNNGTGPDFARGVSNAVRDLQGGGFGTGAVVSRIKSHLVAARVAVFAALILSTGPAAWRLSARVLVPTLAVAIGAALQALLATTSGHGKSDDGWSAVRDLRHLVIELNRRLLEVLEATDEAVEAHAGRCIAEISKMLNNAKITPPHLDRLRSSGTRTDGVDRRLALLLAYAFLRYPWMMLASLAFLHEVKGRPSARVSVDAWREFVTRNDTADWHVLGCGALVMTRRYVPPADVTIGQIIVSGPARNVFQSLPADDTGRDQLWPQFPTSLTIEQPRYN